MVILNIDLVEIVAQKYGPLMSTEEYYNRIQVECDNLLKEFPCHVARRWHSNKNTDLYSYKGLSKSKATKIALEWHKSYSGDMVLRSDKRIEEMNSMFSPSEYAHHSIIDAIYFKDKAAVVGYRILD